MKKILKFVLIFVLVLIIGGCACFFSFVTSSRVISKDKNDYETYYNFHMESAYGSDLYLPDVNEVVNNDNFRFRYYEYRQLIFIGFGTVVSEELSQEEFRDKREELCETFTFLNGPIYSSYPQDMIAVPEGSFNFKGYSFNVISGGAYPKNFSMIAFSEEENRILYFTYYDQDLDYIEDMKDFVNEAFPRWNKW